MTLILSITTELYEPLLSKEYVASITPPPQSFFKTWEPSAATGTIVHHLPALDRFYRETKFSLLKSNLASQNQANNILVGLPSSTIKF